MRFLIANGNGFSAFTFITPRMQDPKVKIWKIKKGTPLPQGIRLVKDLTRQGHYMLAPAFEMPISKFLALLEELASNPAFTTKLSLQEITACPTTPR